MAAEEIITNTGADNGGTAENTGNIPIACVLTPADLAAQAGRWARLAAQAMTGRAQTAHGLRSHSAGRFLCPGQFLTL